MRRVRRISRRLNMPHDPKSWKLPESQIMCERRMRRNKKEFLLDALGNRCGICKELIENFDDVEFDHVNGNAHDGDNLHRCGITNLSWKALQQTVVNKEIQPSHRGYNAAKQ